MVGQRWRANQSATECQRAHLAALDFLLQALSLPQLSLRLLPRLGLPQRRSLTLRLELTLAGLVPAGESRQEGIAAGSLA